MATSCKLVDGRLGVGSAVAPFLLPLAFAPLAALAPLAAFAPTGALAAGFRAVLELELVPVSDWVLLAWPAVEDADAAEVSALVSAGKRWRKSAWPGPVTGWASRST